MSWWQSFHEAQVTESRKHKKRRGMNDLNRFLIVNVRDLISSMKTDRTAESKIIIRCVALAKAADYAVVIL
jgi:hypothetical protein